MMSKKAVRITCIVVAGVMLFSLVVAAVAMVFM